MQGTKVPPPSCNQLSHTSIPIPQVHISCSLRHSTVCQSSSRIASTAPLNTARALYIGLVPKHRIRVASCLLLPILLLFLFGLLKLYCGWSIWFCYVMLCLLCYIPYYCTPMGDFAQRFLICLASCWIKIWDHLRTAEPSNAKINCIPFKQ